MEVWAGALAAARAVRRPGGLLRKEEVTSVLIGASKPQQILDNIKAMENPGFSEDAYSKRSCMSLRERTGRSVI